VDPSGGLMVRGGAYALENSNDHEADTHARA